MQYHSSIKKLHKTLYTIYDRDVSTKLVLLLTKVPAAIFTGSHVLDKKLAPLLFFFFFFFKQKNCTNDTYIKVYQHHSPHI